MMIFELKIFNLLYSKHETLIHHEGSMKLSECLSRIALLTLLVAFCSIISAAQSPVSIGGEPVVTLTRPASKTQEKPHFIDATIAPGRGMN